jgi:hypothetical protein
VLGRRSAGGTAGNSDDDEDEHAVTDNANTTEMAIQGARRRGQCWMVTTL